MFARISRATGPRFGTASDVIGGRRSRAEGASSNHCASPRIYDFMPKRSTRGGRRKSSAKKTSRRTRASPKPSPQRIVPAAEAALVAFVEFAAHRKLRWYLFGAQAANFHGSPRNTSDLDITIDLGDRATPEFMTELALAGFEAPPFATAAFIASSRVIPIVHKASSYAIDLVLAGPGFEQQFLEEVVIVQLGSVEVPVISPENLVVTKVLAGRPRDLEDVRELLAIRALDHSKIEELLGQLEEAIADSELLATYRRLREGR
jgi:hypothetical protein